MVKIRAGAPRIEEWYPGELDGGKEGPKKRGRVVMEEGPFKDDPRGSSPEEARDQERVPELGGSLAKAL